MDIPAMTVRDNPYKQVNIYYNKRGKYCPRSISTDSDNKWDFHFEGYFNWYLCFSKNNLYWQMKTVFTTHGI